MADAARRRAAVLAADGAGDFAGIGNGIAAMVRPGRMIGPDPANVARSAGTRDRYLRLCPAAQALAAGLTPPATPKSTNQGLTR